MNPRYPYDTGTCPRCGGPSDESRRGEPGFPRPGALSRWNNRTVVCSTCGRAEALLVMAGRSLDPWTGHRPWRTPPGLSDPPAIVGVAYPTEKEEA